MLKINFFHLQKWDNLCRTTHVIDHGCNNLPLAVTELWLNYYLIFRTSKVNAARVRCNIIFDKVIFGNFNYNSSRRGLIYSLSGLVFNVLNILQSRPRCSRVNVRTQIQNTLVNVVLLWVLKPDLGVRVFLFVASLTWRILYCNRILTYICGR